MRIDTLLHDDGPVFSFEFFPPKTEAGEREPARGARRAARLEPSFVSVTYGAGGSTRGKTIEIVKRISEQYGLEAMAHFTCVGATVAELRATLDEMQSAGIDNVLALRGDPPAGQEQWRKTEGGLEYSRELVELIAADYAFAIGAACFPETHIHAVSPEEDLEHLAEKVAAGVDFLITQLFFDNALYFDFVAARSRGGRERADHPRHHADHAGGPGRADGQAVRRLDPRRPASRAARARRGPRGGARLRRRLRHAAVRGAARAGAPGIHFYTLNRSPATRAILSALKLARPWERRSTLARSRAPRPRAASRRPPRSARRPSRSGGRCQRPRRPAASASR